MYVNVCKYAVSTNTSSRVTNVNRTMDVTQMHNYVNLEVSMKIISRVVLPYV